MTEKVTNKGHLKNRKEIVRQTQTSKLNVFECLYICIIDFNLWLFPYDKFLQVELQCQQARIFHKLRIYTANCFSESL